MKNGKIGNLMSRTVRAYRENGAQGLFLRAGAKIFKKSGAAFLNASQHFETVHHYRSISQEQWKLLERNRIFKDKHRGKRCFIIGNGSSLKTQDITPLKNEITFVMSAFWKHPVIEKWQPTYYCLIDPLFFSAMASIKDFFDSIRKRATETTFFVPLTAAKEIKQYAALPFDRTFYVAFSNSTNGDFDLCNLVSDVMTVSQLGILAAMYMGCSPIYLLGHDHEWLAHRGPDPHFYEGPTGIENHPEYKPTMAGWSYKFIMECQLKLWEVYEAISKTAHRKGTRILNASNGGFLDVYDRVHYESIVGVENLGGQS